MFEILFLTVVPAVVGILYPVKSKSLIRLQWTAAAILCLSGWSLVFAIAAFWWQASWAIIILALGLTLMLLIVAGGIGHYVERRHLEDEKSRHSQKPA